MCKGGDGYGGGGGVSRDNLTPERWGLGDNIHMYCFHFVGQFSPINLKYTVFFLIFKYCLPG